MKTMPAESPDYKLDLSAGPGRNDSDENAALAGRPYLSVHFACCGVYMRIYRSADGKAYRGRCPRCGRPVTFQVGSEGTDCRFFVVR